MFFRKEPPPVLSIESISVKVSGMRFRHEYEIKPEGSDAVITRYRIMIRDRQDVREPDACAKMSLDDMLSLCSSCGITGWNGFHGAHPKNVSDGEMFTFEAEVNGGEKIRAEGSANFPKHYIEFMHKLNDILRNEDRDK